LTKGLENIDVKTDPKKLETTEESPKKSLSTDLN